MYKERYYSLFNRALDEIHACDDYSSNNYKLWDMTHQAFLEAVTEHASLEERNARQAKKLQEFHNMSVIGFIKYKLKQIKLPSLSITWE